MGMTDVEAVKMLVSCRQLCSLTLLSCLLVVKAQCFAWFYISRRRFV